MLGHSMLRQVAGKFGAMIRSARQEEFEMAMPIVEAVPVVQDKDRFRLLFTNSRPKMPSGYKAPLVVRTTRELINARLAAETANA